MYLYLCINICTEFTSTPNKNDTTADKYVISTQFCSSHRWFHRKMKNLRLASARRIYLADLRIFVRNIMEIDSRKLNSTIPSFKFLPLMQLFCMRIKSSSLTWLICHKILITNLSSKSHLFSLNLNSLWQNEESHIFGQF